ncbi:MAG: PAS domain S-box protein [Gloeobacterales cyanobacterium]
MKVDQARNSTSQKANKAYEAQEETPPLSGIAESTAEQAFADLARLAAHLCKVPLASVNLIEACCQWFQSRAGSKYIEPPTDFTFDAYALLRADFLIVSDTLLDERFATSTLVTADPPIRFYAGMPLFTPKGEALGVLCVMDYVPRTLNLEQVEALRTLGHQVITKLELMRNLLGKGRIESESKQIGTKMNRREQELTDFFEHGAVGLHWVGPAGHILRANQAELALLGYSHEEYVGQHIAKFHVDEEVIEDILQRLSANETLHNYEARLRCKDGSIKHVLIDSNVFWEDGQFIHTRCFTRDISTTKQREEEQRQREEALRQSTRLQQAILDSANYTIISTDPQGIMLTFNAAAQRWLGYSAEEVVGKVTPAIIHDLDEIVQRAEVLSRELGTHIEPGFEVFVAKARQGIPDENEWTYIRKDGSRFPVLLSVTALRDEQGELTGFLGIGSDITLEKRLEEERKQAEEEIRHLNAELEERVAKRTMQLEVANKELEAFSYSVSHDLRAPLRSIDGFSQVLMEDYSERLDDEGRDYLQRIRAAAQRMAHLIDDLLNLARVTRSDMHRERVDLSALAETITTELQQAHPDQVVECIIAPGLVADGDAHLLKIVLENLFSNAWKFTARHPEAHIEFGSIRQPNGQRAYFVRDDGAGFDMAYADKLFGAFQRLHGTTEFPGSGIGLATVQRIIHRHGGRIWAEAALEKGATFYFTLCVEK